MFRTLAIVVALAAISNCYQYSGHRRYRRQLGDVESPQQLDLNVSVPYIFSARLYPYGPTKGDLSINGDEEVYRLENPLHFLTGIFDTIYIRSDGSVGLSPMTSSGPAPLPVPEPTIAVFWQKSKGGNVYYRETDDANIVNLAHNEVNIQYRYGSKFRVKSVVLVTWEGVVHEDSQESEGNIFQLALIVGDEMTFAHMVYSRLVSNNNAVAGFSTFNASYSLPDSATDDVILLSEKSDIGIPGEWLFRVDEDQVFLCGAGFKGLECIESCAPSQWSNDCYHSCHCEGGDACDHETGRCPNAKCSPGWRGEPVCDKDIDECSVDGGAVCPAAQPDCLNTPGSFLCLCFEYDEQTKACKGSPAASAEQFAVEVVPVQPSFNRNTPPSPPTNTRSRTKNTRKTTTATTTKMSTEAPFTHEQRLVEIERSEETQTRATTTQIPSSICSSCDRNARCLNEQCQCIPGFAGNGFSCSDVNECLLSSTCGEHAICANTEGSFDCECVSGFSFVEGRCKDIDECASSPCVGAGVRCVNGEGTFHCECKEGYEGDAAKGCRDINECEQNNACGPNSKCSNQAGGFECECDEGYERLSETSGCIDINECELSPCHPAARCTNLPGSFDCSCIDGFVGDGLQCHETILFPIANDSIVVARQRDALAEILLPHPIKLFGKHYDKAYLSSNGLVSFGSAVSGIVDRPERMPVAAILGLHSQMDYAREGLLAYTYVNDTDASAYSLLTRASLSVQTQFGLSSFHTRHLHLFTFDRMRQAGSENLNSFQIVLAQSDSSTVLSLIYQMAQARGPIVGLSTGSSFIRLPSDVISTRSNVAHPGKWLLLVDSAHIEPCPAGRTPAPMCESECPSGRWGFGCSSSCHCAGGLPCDHVSGICLSGKCDAGWNGSHCDQDVDECAVASVHCDANADCVNTRGSVECHCKNGYQGDGRTCKALDACVSRFGASCHSHARCHSATATCVCQEGYRGDGLSCQPAATLPVIDISKNVLLPSLEALPPAVPADAEVGDHPFVMTSWVTEKATPTSTRKTPLLITGSSTEFHDMDVSTGYDENSEVASSSYILFLAIPVVLCVMWLVIVIIVLAAKSKSRRQSNHKSFDGVWKAPTQRTTTSSSSIRSISAPMPVGGRMASGNMVYDQRLRTYEGY